MGAAFASPRYDVMRLGVIPFPASPRQADLVVISGTVTDKMAPAVVRLYEQMPDPKYVISHGQLRQLRRPLLGQLLGHQGRRPAHPGRRLRARAARRGPRRCSRASCCCRSASRTRTWPSAGGVIRLSSAEGTDATEAAPTPRPPRRPSPRDERREGLLDALRAELGDAVVGSHIRPGRRPLGPGHRRRLARPPARSAKGTLGCTYFDFLSAIDWLPSPFGRDMDSQEDLAVRGGRGQGARRP